MLKSLIRTDTDRSTLIIRCMVGVVFLSEGIQKFLFPEEVGAGRFEKIGFSNPDDLAALVGVSEITCGTLILLGLLTRLASIPLIIIMLAAMSVTKYGIFIGEGFWKMMHAGRNDWAMLLGSLFLLIKGGGAFSSDRYIYRITYEREN